MVTRLVTLGRFEEIGAVPFVANTRQVIDSRGGNLPGDFHLDALKLRVRGRLAITTAAADVVRADAPWSLIDLLTIEGMHSIRRQTETRIRLRGPELQELARMYGGLSPAFTNVGSTVADHDFEFVLYIPFAPRRINLAERAAHALDANLFDSLKCEIKWGTANSLVDPAATTALALTAFGAGTGVPECIVSARYLMYGPGGLAGKIPAAVFRQFEENTVEPVTTATDRRIIELPKGNALRSLLIKTGVKATATTGITAGTDAYDTLSNAILNALVLVRGKNNNIRRYRRFTDIQEEIVDDYAIRNSTGFALLDLAKNGTLGESMRANVPERVELALRGDVTGAASQAALVAWEEIRGVPVGY